MIRYTLSIFASITLTTTSAQWKKFGNFKTYPVEKQVNLFHVKDMNRDQLPDIVNFYSALETKFGILDNNADGTFNSEKVYAKPINFHNSDITDLNKDGFNDLVISSYWDNGFRIFWGNSTGNYNQNDFFGIGGHGRNIKCVDINKDGSMDIIFTSSGSGQAIIMYVYINNGNGTFELPRSYPSMLDTSKDIMITDKDNDGLLDVVVTSSFPWILFYFQQRDGSFKPKYWQTYTIAYPVIKDLDHDNKDDLILLYPSFENGLNSDSIIIKRSLEGDQFATSVSVPQFANKKIRPSIILLDDINNDGDQDIVLNHLDILGNYTDTAYYMLGKGNLEFDDPVLVLIPGKVVKMQFADLNADNFPDWIVTYTNNTMAITLNNKISVNMPMGKVRLYPNPSRDKINIDQLGIEKYEARLYNVSGTLVNQYKLVGPSASFDIRHLPKGVYLFELINSNRKIVRKLVKQ